MATEINKKIESFTRNESSSIKSALECLDASALQILLVCTKDGVLVGSITDGDIRRGLLKGFTLETSIKHVMNKNTITGLQSEKQGNWLVLMKKHNIRQLPILNDNNQVCGLFYFKNHKIDYGNTIVLMLGGLGSRLKPLTSSVPKPMLKVGGVPILETIVKKASDQGFNNFIFCINYLGENIQKYFGDGAQFNVSISYVHEKKRLGTAGALSLISQSFKEPVIVMNGDLLTHVDFRSLLTFHHEQEGVLTSCIKEHLEQIPYGVVDIEHNQVIQVNEKPVFSFYINAGIYALEPEILSKVPKNTFYDMPSLINDLIADDYRLAGFPITDYWIDIGMLPDYHQAQSDYKKHFTFKKES